VLVLKQEQGRLSALVRSTNAEAPNVQSSSRQPVPSHSRATSSLGLDGLFFTDTCEYSRFRQERAFCLCLAGSGLASCFQETA